MNEIKEIFKSIGLEDIDENATDLVSDGILDSMDIMAIATAIKKKYQKKLDPSYLEIENFQSFVAIENMIKKAFSDK